MSIGNLKNSKEEFACMLRDSDKQKTYFSFSV